MLREYSPLPPSASVGDSPRHSRRDTLEEIREDLPRIRDRYQFEIKLNYPLPERVNKITYEVEVYFYLPPSLGINRDTYDKERFYDDLQCHVRLKTPEVGLQELARQDRGPLQRLRAAVLRLETDASPAALRVYEYQVKLFCCTLKSSLREHVQAVRNAIGPEERARLVEAFSASVQEIRAVYHDLGQGLRERGSLAGVSAVYRFADEYMSLVVEEHTYQLLGSIRHGAETADGDANLVALARCELDHRRRQRYASIAHADGDNEEFVFRRSVLKKYTSDVLFLSARTKPGGRFLRETLFGVAAGVSMIFATAVLFLSQSIYGPITAPVFVALVVSYIFKDRIKELLRLALSRRASRLIYDHRTKFYNDPHDCLGVCKESADFMDEGKVPSIISTIRNRAHITDIEDTWIKERLIRYRKQVTLRARRIRELYGRQEIRGVNDIMRFNVVDFVRRTGPPEKPIPTLADDEVRHLVGDRVYHLNLILKYQLEESAIYERFRVVLNRNGIKRIDRVARYANDEPLECQEASTRIRDDNIA